MGYEDSATDEHDCRHGQEALREPVELPFETYEQLCNENNRASRKSGILSDEIYAEALADPTTVFCEVDGVAIPVLVDIHHGLGLGYDEGRATAYASPETPVSALALPIGDLDDDLKEKVVRTIARSGSRSLFFADNEGRDRTALIDGLTAAGHEPREIPLLDRRCREENRQASLSLYICDNTLPGYEAGSSPRVPLVEALRHFEAETLPTIEDPSNATLLKRGDTFTAHDLDDIWALYLDKFQLLGENHPISMEDGKEDFLGILTDPSTLVSIRYVDAKPACFTYFTDTFDGLYWLNTDYLDTLADEKNLTPIFFPGIVARKSDGGYAGDVIRLFAQETAAANINDRIIFENTNLSEMYVPRIIFDSVDGSSEYNVERPHKVDQTHYRLLEF